MDQLTQEREKIKANYQVTDEQLDNIINVANDFTANGIAVNVYDLLAVFDK